MGAAVGNFISIFLRLLLDGVKIPVKACNGGLGEVPPQLVRPKSRRALVVIVSARTSDSARAAAPALRACATGKPVDFAFRDAVSAPDKGRRFQPSAAQLECCQRRLNFDLLSTQFVN
jgi:hypothetical protein